LIIEDDPFIAKMYETKLFNSGYKAIVASTGEQGLDIVKIEKPAIIVLDLVLPELDGFEVLKILKKDNISKNIPVLVLSNLGQKDNVEKALKLGADAYMIKAQFKPSEVLKKIESMIKE